ncbi:hypothetical protein LAZ67_8002744 [Cordylochernes scorpioides]|uniref:Mos1 transposase HTH domain-containing protein n=1 Tax=Cordylochernes scorpioides TaxID=51811 RepID=A0ABY6KR80_9ARAC|nr:hypothetical protein LAZ67_8002744 [Cordylochernes scorpioides]
MVACGISYEGKLKIIKVERNAKINSEYYQNNILEPIFLNDIPSIYGKQSNKVWFHHDNATSHTSSSTQAYLEDLWQRTGINTSPKNRTPVKSPDLAPMDFCIFGCLKRALGKRHSGTIEGLWKVVKEEWDLLSMTMIRKCLLLWKIRTCIKFCVKNEIKCADAFRMLTVAYGEATLDRSNVYRWYKMFSEGREDVNDEARAGRPSTSTTDEKINEVEKMILAIRRITVREVAEDLNIPIGSCHSIFINDLGMRRVAAKFVPKLLNCD